MDLDIILLFVGLGIINSIFSTVQSQQSETFSNNEFKHPGFMVNIEQLNFIKINVENKVEPMFSIFKKIEASNWGSMNYQILGVPQDGEIHCGAYNNPDIGCTNEDNDSAASVAQAILWFVTQNPIYGNNSIKIMNSYSLLYKRHKDFNSMLQLSWTAEKFPIAAEIMRYTSNLWLESDYNRFKDMMRKYKDKLFQTNSRNGNWALARVHGRMGVAVVLDDKKMFGDAIKELEQLIPAYVYWVKGDGGNPKKHKLISSGWNNNKIFNESTSGVSQETCRDLGHTQLGLAALFGCLEAAYVQGIDLYENYTNRLIDTLELHAGLFNEETNENLCQGRKIYNDWMTNTFEIGYTAYAIRNGKILPKTLEHLQKVRVNKVADDKDRFAHTTIFESLLHSDYYKK